MAALVRSGRFEPHQRGDEERRGGEGDERMPPRVRSRVRDSVSGTAAGARSAAAARLVRRGLPPHRRLTAPTASEQVAR